MPKRGNTIITVQQNSLIYRYNAETLRIEPWGENAVRVRAWKQAQMPKEDWALTRPHSAEAQIRETETGKTFPGGQ